MKKSSYVPKNSINTEREEKGRENDKNRTFLVLQSVESVAWRVPIYLLRRRRPAPIVSASLSSLRRPVWFFPSRFFYYQKPDTKKEQGQEMPARKRPLPKKAASLLFPSGIMGGRRPAPDTNGDFDLDSSTSSEDAVARGRFVAAAAKLRPVGGHSELWKLRNSGMVDNPDRPKGGARKQSQSQQQRARRRSNNVVISRTGEEKEKEKEKSAGAAGARRRKIVDVDAAAVARRRASSSSAAARVSSAVSPAAQFDGGSDSNTSLSADDVASVRSESRQLREVSGMVDDPDREAKDRAKRKQRQSTQTRPVSGRRRDSSGHDAAAESRGQETRPGVVVGAASPASPPVLSGGGAGSDSSSERTPSQRSESWKLRSVSGMVDDPDREAKDRAKRKRLLANQAPGRLPRASRASESDGDAAGPPRHKKASPRRHVRAKRAVVPAEKEKKKNDKNGKKRGAKRPRGGGVKDPRKMRAEAATPQPGSQSRDAFADSPSLSAEAVVITPTGEQRVQDAAARQLQQHALQHWEKEEGRGDREDREEKEEEEKEEEEDEVRVYASASRSDYPVSPAAARADTVADTSLPPEEDAQMVHYDEDEVFLTDDFPGRMSDGDATQDLTQAAPFVVPANSASTTPTGRSLTFQMRRAASHCHSPRYHVDQRLEKQLAVEKLRQYKLADLEGENLADLDDEDFTEKLMRVQGSMSAPAPPSLAEQPLLTFADYWRSRSAARRGEGTIVQPACTVVKTTRADLSQVETLLKSSARGQDGPLFGTGPAAGAREGRLEETIGLVKSFSLHGAAGTRYPAERARLADRYSARVREQFETLALDSVGELRDRLKQAFESVHFFWTHHAPVDPPPRLSVLCVRSHTLSSGSDGFLNTVLEHSSNVASIVVYDSPLRSVSHFCEVVGSRLALQFHLRRAPKIRSPEELAVQWLECKDRLPLLCVVLSTAVHELAPGVLDSLVAGLRASLSSDFRLVLVLSSLFPLHMYLESRTLAAVDTIQIPASCPLQSNVRPLGDHDTVSWCPSVGDAVMERLVFPPPRVKDELLPLVAVLSTEVLAEIFSFCTDRQQSAFELQRRFVAALGLHFKLDESSWTVDHQNPDALAFPSEDSHFLDVVLVHVFVVREYLHMTRLLAVSGVPDFSGFATQELGRLWFDDRVPPLLQGRPVEEKVKARVAVVESQLRKLPEAALRTLLENFEQVPRAVRFGTPSRTPASRSAHTAFYLDVGRLVLQKPRRGVSSSRGCEIRLSGRPHMQNDWERSADTLEASLGSQRLWQLSGALSRCCLARVLTWLRRLGAARL
jgi:hypothetical protein